jgi:hypothetical protein
MSPRTGVLLAAAIFAGVCAANAADPDAATLARLKASGVETTGTEADVPPGFPTIVLVSRNVPDAGPFFIGAFVGRKWVGSAGGDTWGGGRDDIWAQVSSAAMRAFNWSHLSLAKREALALRWVRDAQPPGAETTTSPQDPGASKAAARVPAVTAQGGQVIVTAWITGTHESIAGPRTNYPTGATTFTFAADGTVTVAPPDAP